MDNSPGAERLLDCSVSVFNNPDDHFQAAFVDGICSAHIDTAFSSSNGFGNQHSFSEILYKLLKANTENSTEFIRRFISKFEDFHIKAKVYLSKSDTQDSLVNESSFSDVFIVGKDMFQNEFRDPSVLDLVKTLIKNTRCPLLFLSCEQEKIDNMVLLFDGSENSIAAIKTFTHLMSDQLDDKNVYLIVVVNDRSSDEEKNLINYLKNYKLHFSVLRVYPETQYDETKELLKSLGNYMMVSGLNRVEILEELLDQHENSVFGGSNNSLFLL